MTRDQWIAAVARNNAAPVATATVHIDGPTNTMSHAFKVGADDNEEYWIKTLEGVEPSQQPSLALEQVIARVGLVLGASVVQPYLVQIPVGMKLPTMSNGRVAQPGIAHATRSYAACFEEKTPPGRRTEDDNKRRQVGIYALIDLARGADFQYLYDSQNNNAIVSHDHGLYACCTGTMEVAAMIANVAVPVPPPGGDTLGLDAAEVIRVADRLGALAQSEIGDILNLVPSTWPVSDDQLGTLGWFLHQRAGGVASRLRAMTI